MGEAMAADDTPLMTTEEFLALPDDGVERWLIDGRLREQRTPAQFRWHSRWHGQIMTQAACLLEDWRERQPAPSGEVLCGGAGCRLRRDPDSTIGIDVIYVSADVAARQCVPTSLIDGAPVLAADILEPYDTRAIIHERVDLYLKSGVALVWVIDPHDRTVLIYRPGRAPEFVNESQELSGEPQLPGLRLPVAQLFC
jgi:Uma2 family endonuclease